MKSNSRLHKLLGGAALHGASELTKEAAEAKAASALWTFPGILVSAIVIAWGAESAQFLVSQGFALTILALIQTLPEFAIEGVIAYRAGQYPTHENISLMTANFTGALRLLVGLGWPLIYSVSFAFNFKKHKRKFGAPIRLDRHHSVELMGLFVPTLYAFYIVAKGSLHLGDTVILFILYGAYITILLHLPPEHEDKIIEAEPIPRFILSRRRWFRNALVWTCFIVGGGGIMIIAEPFLDSMLGLSVTLGVSTFVFVQWVAPFLSEFPEKISAIYWAKTVTKAPMSLMNMISSCIAELTLLIGMIPIVYCISRGGFYVIEFDHLHRVEIMMTAMQSLLGFLILANMVFCWYEALALFLLWLAQFIYPGLREEILWVYGLYIVIEILFNSFKRSRIKAFRYFREVLREEVFRKGRKGRP
jgi:cation:H+ antiporter